MNPIVVAGEALVDLILDATGGIRPALGGGPFNTARTIARLGGDAAFLGCITRDRFGEQLVRGLIDDGVDTGLVVRTEAPTTLALAELDHDHAARYRFYVDGTAAPQLPEATALRALDADPWALHVGTLGLVFEPIGTSLEALVGRAGLDVMVMLDPNARPSATPDLDAWRRRVARLTTRASIVRATTDDMAVLQPATDPRVTAAAMLAAGPNLVILTDGSRPVLVLTRDGATLEVPVPPVQVVDTVGSGDAFGGAFLAWWRAHGLGRDDLGSAAAVEAATVAAIRVAAITCSRAGADPPTLAELGGWR
ncbi:MAG: PfkB family carbohydrate kinase [Chloroflexi bacterium]|nr:PfkB family carbohydrate kinase [Chloroflexota bacterium]